MFYGLFEPGEGICFTDTVYGTYVIMCFEVPCESAYQFFSINPLMLTRKDANVSAYRNILVEFDQGTIAEQEAIIKQSECPFTTLTFSGSKSVHMIISLETPCESRAAYDALVSRIYAKFPTCDTSARNPSRLSRVPNVKRDNNVLQALIAKRGRVSHAVLEEWLGPTPFKEKPKYVKSDLTRILKGDTLYFLSFGATPGNWNRSLFLTALDMGRSGYEPDEIIDRLAEITGHLTTADRRTIASALNISKAPNQE